MNPNDGSFGDCNYKISENNNIQKNCSDDSEKTIKKL